MLKQRGWPWLTLRGPGWLAQLRDWLAQLQRQTEELPNLRELPPSWLQQLQGWMKPLEEWGMLWLGASTEPLRNSLGQLKSWLERPPTDHGETPGGQTAGATETATIPPYFLHRAPLDSNEEGKLKYFEELISRLVRGTGISDMTVDDRGRDGYPSHTKDRQYGRKEHITSDCDPATQTAKQKDPECGNGGRELEWARVVALVGSAIIMTFLAFIICK